MSLLTNVVDKTIVNYDDVINYTLNVSLSDINDEIVSSRVLVTIPDYMEYSVPSADDSRLTVNETPVEGGTEIEFSINTVGYAGFAKSLRIECRFKYPAVEPNTSFDCSARLFVNDEEVVPPAVAPTVTLELAPEYIVLKQLSVPSTDPSVGGFCVWKIVLRNLGDAGAGITNFTLEDFLPDPVILAEGWAITGNDTSNNRFADTRFDGVVASSVAEDLKSYIFDINGTYTGTEYTIVAIGLVNPQATIGQYADNYVWSADLIPEVNGTASTEIIPDTSTVLFVSDPPQFVKRGNFYSSTMEVENTSNVTMTNIELDIDVPPQISAYKFETGRFGIPDANYYPDIPYTMEMVFQNNLGEVESQIIEGFSTAVNSTVTSDQIIIPDGYTLVHVISRIPQFVPGMTAVEKPATFAIVNDVEPDGTTIQNYSLLTWEANGQNFSAINDSETSIVDNVSLVIIKQQILDSFTSDSYQNGIVRYKATIECPQSYLYEPILVELLPEQLAFIGNESYTYYDYQFDRLYSSDDEDFPLPILNPEEEVLFDTARVVRFSYTGDNSFNLKQRDILTIEFDTKIKDEYQQSPEIQNILYLGNYGPNGTMGPGSTNFPDSIIDYDGDGFYIESLAQSNAVNAMIIFTNQLSANTKIKGSYNLNFVDGTIPVSTKGGQNATFRLILENTGNKPVRDLEIVDIMPHIGDTSIIEPEELRGSQFNVSYFDNEITVNAPTNPLPASFTPVFSDSINPARFNYLNDEIGDGVWVDENTELTKSVKFVQGENPLLPGESVTFDLIVTAPEELEPDLVAFNSFAIRGSYNNNEDEAITIMPLEPYKKGVKGVGAKAINGIVFEDLKQDGIYDFSDPGENGVLVSLYNSEGQKIQETVTKKQDLFDGFYAFDVVDDGDYYLLFTIKDTKLKFTKQVLDNELGSKANKYGFTPKITINSQAVDSTVYAGVIDVAIENILKVNNQANGMVRNAIYSDLALDMKLNDLIDYTGLSKSR